VRRCSIVHQSWGEKDTNSNTQMLAEYRKCGGGGWLLYDSGFCQQIVDLEAVDFSQANQGLHATTYLAYGGKGKFLQDAWHLTIHRKNAHSTLEERYQ